MIYFTADTHLGHRLVSQLRGFGSIAEHDRAVMQNLHSSLTKNDQLWLLGDVNMGNPVEALHMLMELPCPIHLIAGNHDSVHAMHRDSHKYLDTYSMAFDSVQMFARRRIFGLDVLLSHFPYAADRSEARYTQYRLRDEGKYLLHGHTHSLARWTGLREIHVGLDAWDLKPVPLSEIEKMIAWSETVEERER
jgi:calcineurin-like phosphoesterase family protein